MDEASTGIPGTMQAMVTMGHGDIQPIGLSTRLATPKPDGDEVLIKVGACGLNNTDLNPRTGWYSKAVSEAMQHGAVHRSVSPAFKGRTCVVKSSLLVKILIRTASGNA